MKFTSPDHRTAQNNMFVKTGRYARTCILAISLGIAGSSAFAQDFDKAMDAYDAGDYQTAVQQLLPLAEQGNANAQFGLGFMYGNGEGVLQDHKEAVRWYRLAAEQGEATAQFNLGLRYVNGKGVLQDYITAHMWLNIASANGHKNAQKARDLVASIMSQADISKATEHARICMASNYQNCR